MRRSKGREYEEKACSFLCSKGFEILACNFYSRFGEIDIIARKSGVIHFVEVKGGQNFNPIYAITPKKIERIKQTIRFYLFSHHLDLPYCIDAIVICGTEVEWIENITL